MADSPIRKASDLLASILPAESMDKTNMWSEFFRSWKFIAGERFCVHAKPVDVRNGIVIVEADHPGWIQLMQFEQNRMLKKFQNNFPELALRGIAFKVKNEEAKTIAVEVERVEETEGGEAGDAQKRELEKTSVREVLEAVQDRGFRSVLDSLATALEEGNKNRSKGKGR